ncbi:neuronal acetylcholine receptor subunit alpha-7-like [Actinia tenebrosa]|uniref:Neuronal acetylcholine receptor subunit alpha-7-like n=1 Tax=Actinia tenebrosa TaxID=6105 RepID=A0A6P8HFN6_ACTTE|nr:neuronal acetylcholine receptor subunit alpha-7-like [Actinia tenebrosa]
MAVIRILNRRLTFPIALVFNICFSGMIASLQSKTIYDDDEDRLLKRVFQRYNPELRPVIDKRDKIMVTFGISLHQIIDMHEKNQILKTSLWVRQKWHNPFLSWNSSEFGGIQEINVDQSKVWKPDIYLYNNADERVDGALDRFKTKIVVSSNGLCKWLAPIIISSSCKIDVKYFPFDKQACILKFGSWTYDGFKLDIIQEGPFADTKKFVKNGEWDLVDFPAKRNELYYVCCKEPYPDVTYTLNIRRKPTYYYINIIIPCLVITALTLLSFYLPPDSGERITLVITNLLALTVFMLLVAEIMPSTSEVVPLISIYYTCTIMEVGTALVATCIVLKFYFHNPAVSDMPGWVRLVVLTWLARLLKYDLKKKKDSLSRQSFFVEIADNYKEPLLEVADHDIFHRKVENLNRESTNPVHLTPGISSVHLSPNGNLRRNSRNGSIHTIPEKHRESFLSMRKNNIDHHFSGINENYRCSCCHMAQTIDDHVIKLIDSQSSLLSSVNNLLKQTNAKEMLNESKLEWILAANIVDQTCFVIFLVLLFSSTVIIFTQAY